jgi:hypothetical protein
MHAVSWRRVPGKGQASGRTGTPPNSSPARKRSGHTGGARCRPGHLAPAARRAGRPALSPARSVAGAVGECALGSGRHMPLAGLMSRNRSYRGSRRPTTAARSRRCRSIGWPRPTFRRAHRRWRAPSSPASRHCAGLHSHCRGPRALRAVRREHRLSHRPMAVPPIWPLPRDTWRFRISLSGSGHRRRARRPVRFDRQDSVRRGCHGGLRGFRCAPRNPWLGWRRGLLSDD